MAQKMTGALVFDERTDRYDNSLPASLNNTRPAAQRDTERRNRSNHIYQYRLHDTRPYFPAQHTAAGAAPPYN